ncbi:MAG: Fic family protein [Candidatus Yonathbacteria bacterium]|nr:Fic family protein [Candidatus Yonathbacteria bacterium]
MNRPENEEELQKREAVGVIRASRFVRRYAQSHKEITVATICAIHKEIFTEAWPEIAGVYRDEELSITDSDLLLPHPTEVLDLMKELDVLLKIHLAELEGCEGHILNFQVEVTEEGLLCVERLIKTTAWLHHAITAIHPFREGNGRTARLAGNLILERYGLVGISVKIEKENKNGYRKALAQIDKREDYEPLEAIISDGIIDRYHGVAVKYYNA